MRKPCFDTLIQRLNEAGIAPRFVIRLGRELQDHFADLEEEALRAHKSPGEAATEALRRLGNEQTIAREFFSRPELLGWIYRSRWFLSFLRALSWMVIVSRRIMVIVSSTRSALFRVAVASAAAFLLMASLLLGIQAFVSGEPVVERQPAILVVNTVPWSSASEIMTRRRHESEPPPEVNGVSLQVRLSPLTRPEAPAIEPIVTPSQMLAFEHTALEPGPFGMASPDFRISDGDYLPIVKVAPVFPAVAASRGLEGYVVIEYTVTPSGSVQNPTVVESSSVLFEHSAVEAVSKFKYKPRVIGGRAVPVSGVRTKVRFVLEV